MIKTRDSFGAFEAKTHFSNLLDRVEKGERITITRHGRKIAVLAPAQEARPIDLVAMANRALELSKGTSLPKGMTIKDMINAGRKR